MAKKTYFTGRPTVATYYNEIDPQAADWLRELIRRRVISDGEVDTRSIVDVHPDDVRGFTRCHFFAGIGAWDFALDLAGWPETRKVWTGSCPCQPFSVAGKSEGTDDPRHLWPEWFRLIRVGRPDTILGEQTAGKSGRYWLDLVSVALEGDDYAFAPFGLPAASVGSPQGRARYYFVADDNRARRQVVASTRLHADGERRHDALRRGVVGALGGAVRGGLETGIFGCAPGTAARAWERLLRAHDASILGDTERTGSQGRGVDGERWETLGSAARRSLGGPVGDAGGSRLQGQSGHGDDGDEPGWFGAQPARPAATAGATGGFWRDCEWVECREPDGSRKIRPVGSRTLPVVDGLPCSLGHVRDSLVVAIEKEVLSYAATHQVDAGEAMFNVWMSLTEEALGWRQVGGLHGVSQAPVLLSFLRQLTEQGWTFAESISRASSETSKAILRGVPGIESPARASCRRGLDEQRDRELADAVRVLSSILARAASEAWTEAFDQNAAASVPLAHDIAARVMRLRGYGNAIVPWLAAAFIESYLELGR